jgi:hypothetical protein
MTPSTARLSSSSSMVMNTRTRKKQRPLTTLHHPKVSQGVPQVCHTSACMNNTVLCNILRGPLRHSSGNCCNVFQKARILYDVSMMMSCVVSSPHDGQIHIPLFSTCYKLYVFCNEFTSACDRSV